MRNYLLILMICCISEADAQSKSTAENIFIITLDGLRWQELFTGADSALVANKTYVRDPLGLKKLFWADTPEERRKTLMPFFWTTVAEKGQLFGNRRYGNKVNCSNKMWFSYPGYSEILTGFADDDRIKSNNKIDNPNVTVLEFLNGLEKFRGKVAAFGSWDVFPFIINESRSGIPVNAGFDVASGKQLSSKEVLLNELQQQIPSPWDAVRLDAFTHHYCKEYIKKNDPKIVFISYGETDDFAHDGKYDAYLKSAHQTDAFIRDLWSWVQSHPTYRGRTTFLITTDHGRGTQPLDTWKSHGADINGAGEIWFAVMGPGIPPRGERKETGQYFQNQFAKTAASLVGADYTNMQPVGEVISFTTERAK